MVHTYNLAHIESFVNTIFVIFPVIFKIL